MPAAVAVPLIIGAASAGAQVYGAKKASSAAKSAAQTQVAAVDKAQAANDRAYADQKAALAPYQQAGGDSLARLMAQHWGTALPQGMSPTGGSSATLGASANAFIPRPAPPPQPGQSQGGAPTSLAAMQAGGGQPPMPPQPPQAGGQMVRVRAPTGEMAQFADGSPGLQQALAKGAVRV